MLVWQHDRVEIIANDQGDRTTPSYVGFTDTERLIGDAAKNQVAMNPTNTVFEVRSAKDAESFFLKQELGKKRKMPKYQAISVAERVADERCEGSPGSSGCLVGYQVRLDSARSEKTKLLFCTTGILLRKLAGQSTRSSRDELCAKHITFRNSI